MPAPFREERNDHHARKEFRECGETDSDSTEKAGVPHGPVADCQPKKPEDRELAQRSGHRGPQQGDRRQPQGDQPREAIKAEGECEQAQHEPRPDHGCQGPWQERDRRDENKRRRGVSADVLNRPVQSQRPARQPDGWIGILVVSHRSKADDVLCKIRSRASSLQCSGRVFKGTWRGRGRVRGGPGKDEQENKRANPGDAPIACARGGHSALPAPMFMRA